uniref:PurM-like N-terminal domain-containing protein n=1 Tax=Lactuca sativa TaxID=4236 RepID=A0A9R1X4J7_LACSA|nr:hypothetical protein LSAT_V11C700375990 [Lactuca sativa]
MELNLLLVSKTEDSNIKLTEFGISNFIKPGESYHVPGTDGVGTKLKLALETGINDSIGIDLIGMSVNDIITSTAKPLFFLDYYATSCSHVDLVEKVIKGTFNGCQQFDSALVGGELKAPMKVFGDLHGQLGDLMRLFDGYVFPSTARDNVHMLSF